MPGSDRSWIAINGGRRLSAEAGNAVQVSLTDRLRPRGRQMDCPEFRAPIRLQVWRPIVFTGAEKVAETSDRHATSFLGRSRGSDSDWVQARPLQ